jgi:magnesium chelatase family protein
MAIFTYTPLGAEGVIIRVEADLRRGIPGIDISGLAEGAVKEARERVRAAFRNSGLDFPPERLLINLAPAGLKKDGASLDLPMALAIYAQQTGGDSGLMALGELELSGNLRPVAGVLAAVSSGLEAGIRAFIVPEANGREAALLADGKKAQCCAASNLAEAVAAYKVFQAFKHFPPKEAGRDVSTQLTEAADAFLGDFAEVKGQEHCKRAMEIAAAGGHNILVFGPPGAGKTMLARRLPGIMAGLDAEEAVEVTRLHSLAGCFLHSPSQSLPQLITRPPFRSPHHSSSAEGILGGGRFVRPGEVSLAHYGVLFLDETPEFRANVLQALREPLEERAVTIVRSESSLRLPAAFQLVLAANPCPCGKLGAAHADACFCTPDEIYRYWKKFSGALLDRVELRVPVKAPLSRELTERGGETSAMIRKRVEAAVAIQRTRFKKQGGNRHGKIRRNANMGPGQSEQFCPLGAGASSALQHAMDKLGLSGRAYHGLLRVARSIADLEGQETIASAHIDEAVALRRYGEDPYDILALG